MEPQDNHGLKGRAAMIANASAMTLIAFALIAVYIDMRGFMLSEINYQRQDMSVWRSHVDSSHDGIITSINRLSGNIEMLSHDLRRNGTTQKDK